MIYTYKDNLLLPLHQNDDRFFFKPMISNPLNYKNVNKCVLLFLEEFQGLT